MAQVNAQMVKELRQRTGAGMMDCKRCMDEADGNMEKAVELIRKAGLAKGNKQESREAGEGLLGFRAADDGSAVTIVQMSSSTDFTAHNDEFRTLLNELATLAFEEKCDRVAEDQPGNGPALLSLPYKDADVKEVVTALAGKTGENIQVARVARLEGAVGWYVHHDNKQAAAVRLSGVNGEQARELGKELAMHVVFSKPKYLDRGEVPKELSAKEKEIAAAQLKDDPKMQNKPPQVLEKIAEGKLSKFFGELCLRDQPYFKDNTKTVKQILKQHGAEVEEYVLFEIGAS